MGRIDLIGVLGVFFLALIMALTGVKCFEYIEANRVLASKISTLESEMNNVSDLPILDSALEEYVSSNNPKVYSRLSKDIVSSARLSGKKYSIYPIMILAIIRAESEFNVNAESKTGAEGLMQIQLNIWEGELKTKGILKQRSDIYDPFVNIEAGCYILRSYLDETKDFNKAMDKYLGAKSKEYKDGIKKYIGEIFMLSITSKVNSTYNIK
jgi:soluble lytic murein transglycosylase-like protein